MEEVKKVTRTHEKSEEGARGWLKRIGLYLDRHAMHSHTADSHPWSAKQEVGRRGWPWPLSSSPI